MKQNLRVKKEPRRSGSRESSQEWPKRRSKTFHKAESSRGKRSQNKVMKRRWGVKERGRITTFSPVSSGLQSPAAAAATANGPERTRSPPPEPGHRQLLSNIRATLAAALIHTHFSSHSTPAISHGRKSFLWNQSKLPCCDQRKLYQIITRLRFAPVCAFLV